MQVQYYIGTCTMYCGANEIFIWSNLGQRLDLLSPPFTNAQIYTAVNPKQSKKQYRRKTRSANGWVGTLKIIRPPPFKSRPSQK